MILHPLPPHAPGDGVVPAWDAVGRAQRTVSDRYLLVHQPDHAHLAGELVQHLVLPHGPTLSDDIVRGIWMHDEGWRDFDSGQKKLEATPARYSVQDVATNDKGKPLSFFDIKPGDALLAWQASIEDAEAVAPIAGLIVSGHFYRLARFGLQTKYYSGDHAESMKSFISQEERRHDRLLNLQSRTVEEVSYWTEVLRFCDLLSLVLCCGVQDDVEFPEPLGPQRHTIRLKPHDGAREFSPRIFDRETEFGVTAYQFPEMTSTNLRFTVR